MSGLFIFIALLFISCTGLSTATDQTCGNKVVNTIFVDQNGSGEYRTVQAAIDSVPAPNSQWIKIIVKRGVYVERVKIPLRKPCMIVEGEGQGVTTITYNANEATNDSYTFITDPSNVVVRNLTIMNSYNRLSSLSKPSWKIKPAVALEVYGDKSAFYNCDILGLQDTLWDVKGKHYFKNCYIEGAIDFIFGSGQSIYEDCHIHATAGVLAPILKYGYITAQGRPTLTDPSGFVFLRGIVTGTMKVQLGRAYGNFSRVIFFQTDFASVVDPLGWSPWNVAGHEPCITYEEVECKGAGSYLAGRAPWINKLEPKRVKEQFANNYSFIDQDGWLSNIPSF